MSQKLLIDTLWLAQPVLQGLLLGLMLRNGASREYKTFFRYTLFQAVSEVALFVLRHNYALYYYGYWTTSAIFAIWSFFVVHELFQLSLKPFDGIRDAGVMVFRWASGVMLLVAVVSAYSGTSLHAFVANLIMVEIQRCALLLQLGLLLFLTLCASYLGLSYKSRIFVTAFGFGLCAVPDLLEGLLFSGGTLHLTWDIAIMSIDVAVFAAWIVRFWLPEPKRTLRHIPMSSPLVRWNEVAADLGHSTHLALGNEPEPFMPSIERMVDDVLRREKILPSRNESA